MLNIRTLFGLGISLIISSASSAQIERAWSRNYTDNRLFTKVKHQVATDSHGNCFLVSQSYRAVSDQDIQIRKIGPDGAFLWERWIAGTAHDNDAVYAVIVDSLDNLIIAGEVQNASTGRDALLAKYSPTGEVVFMNQTDGGHHAADAWCDLKVGSTGTLYVAGFQNETTSEYGTSTQIVEAYTSAGGVLWTNRVPGLSSVEASNVALALRPAGLNSLEESTDGTFHPSLRISGPARNKGITPKTVSPNKVINPRLVITAGEERTDYPSTLLVFRPYGPGRGNLKSTNVDLTSGLALSTKDFPSYIFGPRDIHYSGPPGSELPWVADLGVIDQMKVLTCSPGGDLTLFGNCSYSGTHRVFVIRINSRMVPVWATRYDPPSGLDSWVSPNGAVVDGSGNCYVGGNSGASAARSRGYVARISNSGAPDWQYSDPRLAWLGGGIALDSARGFIYASGSDESLGSTQPRVCVMSFTMAAGVSRLIEVLDSSSYRFPGVAFLGSYFSRPNDMALSSSGTLFVGGEFGAMTYSASLLIAYKDPS